MAKNLNRLEILMISQQNKNRFSFKCPHGVIYKERGEEAETWGGRDREGPKQATCKIYYRGCLM